MPAVWNICAAYLPHGTVSAHSDSVCTLARSWLVLILSGLPFLVTITSRCLANTGACCVALPAVWSLVMLSVSAEANTSAGAPWAICSSSAPDDPKLKVAVVPLYFFWKSSPIWVKASVSEAAA